MNEKGEVNYQAVQKDPQLLNSYLKQVKRVVDLVLWPREERLAFWINAYHAGVIHAIVQHYPIQSIQDIPGVWDSGDVVQVGFRGNTLNAIRFQQLIGAFRDEKIQTALACGAKSCPPLPREAYTGPQVEGQLFLAAQRFVNDPDRNKIIPGQKNIELSSLFKWYATNFKLDFGAAENEQGLPPEVYAVLSFVAHYLTDLKKIEFLESSNYKVKYLPFDWSLNEWVPREEKASASPASS